jgi:hypothetical protein
MGMFDTYKNFEEHFKEGDTFTLQGAKLGAKLNTIHGESQQVLFKIGDEVYSAFGMGFVGQAQRADARDFPVEVTFTTQPPKKPGNNPTKLLWPVGLDKPWETGDDSDIPF